MADMHFNFQQKMLQQYKLSPQMMQSIELIQLPLEDLCERVYKEVEKNPALEIVKDANFFVDSIKIKSKANSKSDTEGDFQMYIENMVVHEKSLKENFLEQLLLLKISEQERSLAERLIQNLNDFGFHNESPEKLLFEHENKELLSKALEIIRNLEPFACGFYTIKESLIYQAESRKDFPILGIEILKNHFEILGKQRSQLIKKHLENHGLVCSLEDLETALTAIKTLNPNPASQFSLSSVSSNYIVPEIIVRKREKDFEEDDVDFEIDFLRGVIPEIIVSPVYVDVMNTKNGDSSFAKNAVNEATQFIASLDFRMQAVHKLVKEIVLRQNDFFCKGPGNLIPLRQKDLAEILGINESTVSRIVTSKYLQCEWGIYTLKYFFTNSVQSNDLEENSDLKQHSKESIKHIIGELLHQQEKSTTKKLSDSKIVELLAEKGIHVARRTVTKYRNELNLKSSFDRL